ncbi:acylphosphatase [Candidatus Moduliflexus flocculans]|uniref:Acylphosphatase n=1 Tax=Candidatus Moduliflexus flocculans TaxID=1499966 RepID=A0A081BLH9_9BACT|nr:acylphosphatase [Candidatus Moduliflexus flocculans]
MKRRKRKQAFRRDNEAPVALKNGMALTGMHVYVSGRVQGVAFRYSAIREATALGLEGWVKNLRDGRVELLVEGEESDVNAMLAWCYHGPSGAYVTDVEIERLPYSGDFSEFNVVYY